MASKTFLPKTAMAVRDPHRAVRYHGRLGFTSQQRELLPCTPATRLVPVGSAGNAMVLHGLGVVNQPLYLGPMFFPNKPTPRLIAPGGEAQHLHDATLGRALAML